MRLMDVCFSNQQVKFASQQNCKIIPMIPEITNATAKTDCVIMEASIRTGLTNLWPKKGFRLPNAATTNAAPPLVVELRPETVVDKSINPIVR